MTFAHQTFSPSSIASGLPTASFRAFLFDMDGTIVNSIAAAEFIWGAWARRHGVDVVSLMATMHGKRSQDIVAALNLPGIDPVAEGAAINRIETETVEGVAAIDGAKRFLRSLPETQWAVVTSSPRALALARIKAAGLPMPKVLITSEDVTRGKPHPEPFLTGAARLGVAPEDCLVFEDAPAGIASGLASGAQVVAITETFHTPYAGPVPSCRDYTRLGVVRDDDGTLRLVSA